MRKTVAARRPSAARTRRGDQLGGGEVAVLLGDQGGQRPARLGQAVAGAVEGGDDRGRVGHRGRLAQLRHSLNCSSLTVGSAALGAPRRHDRSPGRGRHRPPRPAADVPDVRSAPVPAPRSSTGGSRSPHVVTSLTDDERRSSEIARAITVGSQPMRALASIDRSVSGRPPRRR